MKFLSSYSIYYYKLMYAFKKDYAEDYFNIGGMINENVQVPVL